MIIRARFIVTMNGAPIENGAVVVAGDRIANVGTFAEVKAQNAGEVVDLGEQILLPGLINAHCHLDYTCLRGKIPRQKSFADWIRAINAEKAKLSDNDYLTSIAEGFREAEKFGTTSIVNLEAFPELIRQVAQPPARTWWCAELIDVRSPERANEIADLALKRLRDVASAHDYAGLAPHSPFTASANLFRRCDQLARWDHLLLTTHLAESREEMEMFREGEGMLFEFMQALGRPMDDCGNKTPLAILSDYVHLDERWIIAHLNELAAADFDVLEKNEKKFHVVHCPGSHRYFGHERFALEKLRALGFNICLGTDSLASNTSLSLFAEMRALRNAHPSLSAIDILAMVTLNPARALRLEAEIGQIAPGFFADAIALPATGNSNVAEEIIGCETPVLWMMIGGREVGRR
jgi:cytosine/adenosine deaminase-related metal-dependent hydrolase